MAALFLTNADISTTSMKMARDRKFSPFDDMITNIGQNMKMIREYVLSINDPEKTILLPEEKNLFWARARLFLIMKVRVMRQMPEKMPPIRYGISKSDRTVKYASSPKPTAPTIVFKTFKDNILPISLIINL